MIYIDRSRIPEPQILHKLDRQNKTETEKAIEFYKGNPGREDSFNFKVYKDKQVKNALGDLFHGKCAYCESDYTRTQPPDIEHFRPKSAVKINGKLERPGYYWLAADWKNLLPSCIDCNRERKQDVEGKIKLAGKANWFPIVGTRVKSHEKDVYQDEVCLLINPCEEKHPDDHLDFIERADKGVILYLSDEGEHSIEVFALNRSGLVDARRDYFLRVKKQVKKVTDQLITLSGKDDLHERTKLQGEINDLLLFSNEKEEYAGLARQIIKNKARLISKYAQDNLPQDLQDFLDEKIKEASEANDWGW
jgi:uncharacterized protein (TIGR02646 family)